MLQCAFSDTVGDQSGVAETRYAQLFNLADDIGERHDLATKHADIVARVEKIMQEQHVPSATFPLKSIDKPSN